MSKLGSLFGSSGPSENNDALKYSAPKEPKQRQSSISNPSIVVPGPTSTNTHVVSSPTPVVVAPAQTSKILTSVAVRLFKFNSTTGSYEQHDGGSLLGCVIMGMELQYQILIYNGQKVPQATVPLSSSFTFNVRDLYMSFTDSQNNQWSVLFDQVDTMTSFLKILTVAVAHIAMHKEANSPYVKFTLPSSQAGSSEDPALTTGMAAGIYYTIWEVGDLSSYPNDIFNETSFKSIQPSAEVVKIKLGTGDDPIGGMSEALIGCKKGDKIWLGVSVRTAYSGSINMSTRVRPASWMFIEIDIVKVKSSSESEKKKSSKKKEKEEVISTPIETNQQQPIDNPQQSQQGTNDIVSRMRALSGGAGMIGAAPVMNTTTTNKSPEITTNTPVTIQQPLSQQQPIQQQQTPVQQQLSHPSTTSSFPIQQPQAPQYTVAVVEGQDARSYYMSGIY
jgi:hypothetical protein